MSLDEKALRTLIPDSTFTVTRDGVTDFEEIERRAGQLIELLSSPPTLPEIPTVSTVGIIRKLLPKIPTVSIPTRAELQRYVTETIERKKKEQQERLLLRQLADEVREQTPFTARRNLINKTTRVRPR